jgi:hypothetical protein
VAAFRCAPLTHDDGMLILDLVGGEIGCVEMLDQNDVRRKLDEILPLDRHPVLPIDWKRARSCIISKDSVVKTGIDKPLRPSGLGAETRSRIRGNLLQGLAESDLHAVGSTEVIVVKSLAFVSYPS